MAIENLTFYSDGFLLGATIFFTVKDNVLEISFDYKTSLFFGWSKVAGYKTSLFFEVPKWLFIKPYFF